jgi:hypothetical protein
MYGCAIIVLDFGLLDSKSYLSSTHTFLSFDGQRMVASPILRRVFSPKSCCHQDLFPAFREFLQANDSSLLGKLRGVWGTRRNPAASSLASANQLQCCLSESSQLQQLPDVGCLSLRNINKVHQNSRAHQGTLSNTISEISNS